MVSLCHLPRHFICFFNWNNVSDFLIFVLEVLENDSGGCGAMLLLPN